MPHLIFYMILSIGGIARISHLRTSYFLSKWVLDSLITSELLTWIDQRPKESAGITHADICRDSKCQVPRVETSLVDQQRSQGDPSQMIRGEHGKS